MAHEKLPLSVLLALGLAGCAGCRACVCLSPVMDQEGGEELRPCLSFVPVEPEPPVEPDPPPEAPPDVCLSIAPPEEPPPPIPEADEPSAPETVPDDPPRPCLSVRWEPPPRPPDEADPETLPVCLSEDLDPEELGGDGASTLEPEPGVERVALLGRMDGVIPLDVLRQL